MIYLYITNLAHFQTVREPNIQEISMMKAGSMKIYCVNTDFSLAEFELVTDRGLTEKVEVVE